MDKQGRPLQHQPTVKSLLTLALALSLSATAARAADAADNWTQHCAACHGKDGAGHTKAGKKLGVKDLTAVENQKKFSDDDAFNSLKNGLKGDDGTSTKMKPFSEKLSDDDIKALVAYVRNLAK
jgi:mono/diheme cytochrome c family protein